MNKANQRRMRRLKTIEEMQYPAASPHVQKLLGWPDPRYWQTVIVGKRKYTDSSWSSQDEYEVSAYWRSVDKYNACLEEANRIKGNLSKASKQYHTKYPRQQDDGALGLK